MAEYRYVVLSNAAEGREAEFDRWYEDVHLADVLKLHGFVAARRYANADASAAPGAPACMTIYEIQSDDVEATVGQLSAAVADGSMPLSDAMQMPPTVYLYRACGPRHVKDGSTKA